MDHPAVNQDLQHLADDYWAFSLRRSPTSAWLLGIHDHDAEIEDLSRDAEDEAIEALEGFAEAAGAIRPENLTSEERITRGVLQFEASSRAGELRSRPLEFAADTFEGVHIAYVRAAPQFPLTDAAHAQALVEKWSKLGRLLDQAVARLRQGIARDRTPPRVALEKVLAQIDTYLATPLEADGYINLEAPSDFDEAQTVAWRTQLEHQVTDVIRPGYARLRAALVDEVLPKTRPPERSGVVWLPDGDEIYAAAIRRHTSLDLPALTIHRFGTDEVAGLASEYRELGSPVLGTDDLAEIYQRLREDPELRFDESGDVVAAAQGALDRATAAIPAWFGRLPRAGCEMAEVPSLGAGDAPLAYYLPPAENGSRPGTYFVNTSPANTPRRYESEALAFHESVPGHHLQLAIAQELDNLPAFRRNSVLTVFVEGWGLYAERLADEMGLYTDDLDRMGILSFDSWRAGRLVVDTGLHALGWSRDEAIRYLNENSPQAPNNIVNEVDRYIAWPGQALAYKMGQRALLSVRDEARTALGDRFDIREFHDTVLGSGPVPLALLEGLVRDWLATN
jgi:uncharacterized protein (DUF885 family)